MNTLKIEYKPKGNSGVVRLYENDKLIGERIFCCGLPKYELYHKYFFLGKRYVVTKATSWNDGREEVTFTEYDKLKEKMRVYKDGKA